MDDLSLALQGLVAIPAFVGSIYAVLRLAAVVRFQMRRSAPAPGLAWPGVTILKPICGLEKGLASLREEVGKSGNLDRFAASVADLKAAGLGVSLTVLVGLGGADRASAHREATTTFVERLPLDVKDRVYLSPLGGRRGAAAEHRTADLTAWRGALAGRTGARLGEYRIERFAFLT